MFLQLYFGTDSVVTFQYSCHLPFLMLLITSFPLICFFLIIDKMLFSLSVPSPLDDEKVFSVIISM